MKNTVFAGFVRRVVTVALAALSLTATGGDRPDRSPAAYELNSRPFGKSFEQWDAEWWQTIYSLPASVNPLLDTTGEKCMVGQHGPVWFLGGSMVFTPNPNPSGPPTLGQATRTCKVPSDVALLVPVLNCEWDNLGVNPPYTVTQLRQFCKENIDGSTGLFLEVDGKPVNALTRFRVGSPVFNYTLPDDNIIQALGYPELGTQLVFPAVAEGYFVMLKPLPPGPHTIHFGGSNAFISLDIQYRLDVVPVN